MGAIKCLLPTFFEISIFVFKTHIGLEQLEEKLTIPLTFSQPTYIHLYQKTHFSVLNEVEKACKLPLFIIVTRVNRSKRSNVTASSLYISIYYFKG